MARLTEIHHQHTPEAAHLKSGQRRGKKDDFDKDGGFQDPTNTVNVIFGRLHTKCSQKLILREMLSIEPVGLTFLK
jgi:hypothetical protein